MSSASSRVVEHHSVIPIWVISPSHVYFVTLKGVLFASQKLVPEPCFPQPCARLPQAPRKASWDSDRVWMGVACPDKVDLCAKNRETQMLGFLWVSLQIQAQNYTPTQARLSETYFSSSQGFFPPRLSLCHGANSNQCFFWPVGIVGRFLKMCLSGFEVRYPFLGCSIGNVHHLWAPLKIGRTQIVVPIKWQRCPASSIHHDKEAGHRTCPSLELPVDDSPCGIWVQ